MVRSDSRLVEPGDVFVAIPGASADGSAFVADALGRGAVCVVAQDGVSLPESAQAELVTVDDPRRALGELASAYFNTSAHDIQLVGITGTNGKTTVSYILEHLLLASGRTVGVMGTVSYRWPGQEVDAPLTTPDCWSLHEMISQMAADGVDTVVMEVSSHALDQDRVWGLAFDAAILTNVTQDHLDYHRNMEAYFAAKSRLFSALPKQGKAGVINADDPWGAELAATYEAAVPFSLNGKGAENGLHGSIIACTSRGVEMRMRFRDQEWTLTSPLIGRHNASNLLAAQGVGLALGLTPQDMDALEQFAGVPGRLERVENDRGLDVFVDYAHTPDALENVLGTVAELDFKRLFCVFGCGGNRDKAKRPLMGEAVCRHADVAVLTSDNPRDEEPLAIMDDVRPGLGDCTEVIEDADRREAIGKALDAMQAGDVLVIAGKGHETYQIVKGVRHDFNDASIVRELSC